MLSILSRSASSLCDDEGPAAHTATATTSSQVVCRSAQYADITSLLASQEQNADQAALNVQRQHDYLKFNRRVRGRHILQQTLRFQ
jgi:hypothetical protein